MKTIKEQFQVNEWKLIAHLLVNGKDTTWGKLAIDFRINPSGNTDQRRKAANDIWRKFRRITKEYNFG